ncbi:MAG: hypothetical protein KAU10_09340, partial [Dehalococcoidia bacterium]|nr:hypothetical protein [Dehalococcoidia bacterium]
MSSAIQTRRRGGWGHTFAALRLPVRRTQTGVGSRQAIAVLFRAGMVRLPRDATNEFLGLGMEVSLALALAVSKSTELPAERRESTDP